MARRPAPTKANLFKAQKELRFAKEGRDLLQQKRDVLVMELMEVVTSFAAAEEDLRRGVTGALAAFLPAYVVMGRASAQQAFGGIRPELDLAVRQRVVMGLVLPEVAIGAGGDVAFPGCLASPPAADRAVAELRVTLGSLSRYVEILATIWRLATEIEKTQRRINALENIAIPAARETIAWIRAAMEENDREELFRRKLLKKRTG
jgi:V/A-type H+-transporting ATPase subunit D